MASCRPSRPSLGSDCRGAAGGVDTRLCPRSGGSLRLYVLGPDANADQIAESSPQERHACHQPGDPGKRGRYAARQGAAQQALLKQDLQALGQIGRGSATTLYLLQVLALARATAQRRGQDVGRRDGILNGQVVSASATRLSPNCMLSSVAS